MDYSHQSTAYQVPAPPVEQSDWAGYIALFLVVALIIIVIIFYLYTRNRGNTSVWTFVQGVVSGGSDTFVGNNYTVYVVTTTSATLALTVTAPTTALGQTFGIDNTKTSTSTTVTLSGHTLGTVAPGKFAQFTWNSQTSSVRMY